MKRSFTAALAVLSVFAFTPAVIAQQAATQSETYTAPEGAIEVYTPMRDETVLAGNLYLPEGEGPWPCIVTRTPYLKDARYGRPGAGELSDQNRWMSFGNWPPAPNYSEYYLHPNGSLSTRAPSGDDMMSYQFDPANPVPTFGGANLTFERGPMDQRAVGERGDYLRFETDVLSDDVMIAGPVTMQLYAATDGPDTDFMVKLVDVYPDGYEAIALDSAIRTRYRNGREPDQIEMMTPNAPVELTIDLWDTAITFEEGHRIAVHVTSSNYPRFDVNPNTGEHPSDEDRPRVAQNTIYMTDDRPSAIILPIIYNPE